MRRRVLSVLFLVVLSSVLVASQVSAALPYSFHYWFFTVNVNGYQLQDSQHLIVFGSAQQDSPFTIRILSVYGEAKSGDGTVLGYGQLDGLPLDLPAGKLVQLQASVASYYTAATMNGMGIQSVNAKLTVTYCFPWLFGCAGPFQFSDQRTFTASEIQAVLN